MGLNMPSWVATCCIRRRPRSFSVSANFTTRLDEAPWARAPHAVRGAEPGASSPAPAGPGARPPLAAWPLGAQPPSSRSLSKGETFIPPAPSTGTCGDSEKRRHGTPPTRRGHPGPQGEGWEPEIVPKGDQTENASSQAGRASRLPRTPSSRPLSCRLVPNRKQTGTFVRTVAEARVLEEFSSPCCKGPAERLPSLGGTPFRASQFRFRDLLCWGAPHPHPATGAVR